MVLENYTKPFNNNLFRNTFISVQEIIFNRKNEEVHFKAATVKEFRNNIYTELLKAIN